MKRLLAAGALAAMALGLVPAQAEDKTGTILVSTGTVSRTQRCAATTGAGTPVEDGVFGHTFEVIPEAAFTLKAAGGSSGDFDISFYNAAPTPCDENSNTAGSYTNNNAPVDATNDEAGIVPADATHASITMFAGPPGSAFVYDETVAE